MAQRIDREEDHAHSQSVEEDQSGQSGELQRQGSNSRTVPFVLTSPSERADSERERDDARDGYDDTIPHEEEIISRVQ